MGMVVYVFGKYNAAQLLQSITDFLALNDKSVSQIQRYLSLYYEKSLTAISASSKKNKI